MTADKYSVLGWFVSVRKDNKPDGEVLGYNMNIPQGFGKSPVPFTIQLDSAFRPLTQKDAEYCMWIRMYWSTLDKTSQDFLAGRWIKAAAFRVTVQTKVKIKGDTHFASVGMTLSESFVKINKQTDIVFVKATETNEVKPEDTKPDATTTNQTENPDATTTNQTENPDATTTNQTENPDATTTNQTENPDATTTTPKIIDRTVPATAETAA